MSTAEELGRKTWTTLQHVVEYRLRDPKGWEDWYQRLPADEQELLARMIEYAATLADPERIRGGIMGGAADDLPN